MEETNLAKLKKQLKQLLHSEADLKQLEAAHTAQAILALVVKGGLVLTKKLEIELKTRDPQELFSDTLTKLINLRKELVRFLMGADQQQLINEHWQKILQQYTQQVVQTQQKLHQNLQNTNKVERSLILQQFDNETEQLVALQKQQAQLCAEQRQSALPASPTPLHNTRSQLATLLHQSKLLAVASILSLPQATPKHLWGAPQENSPTPTPAQSKFFPPKLKPKLFDLE